MGEGKLRPQKPFKSNKTQTLQFGIEEAQSLNWVQGISVWTQIIELITQTKEHINKLYKDPIQFGLNRYETILPCIEATT